LTASIPPRETSPRAFGFEGGLYEERDNERRIDMNKALTFIKAHPKKLAAAAVMVAAGILWFFDPDAAKTVWAIAAAMWGG
jgi:hypothetical protein